MRNPGIHRPRSFVPVVATAMAFGLPAWAAFVLIGRPLSVEDGLGWGLIHSSILDLAECARREGTPPLYYLLLQAWAQVWGEGAASLRGFSAVSLLAATLGLWCLAGRLWPEDRQAPPLIALGWLLLPYTTWYGLYVSPQSLSAALMVWSVVAFVEVEKKGRTRDQIILGLLQFAGLATDYQLAFPWAILAAHEMIAGSRTGRRSALIRQGLVVLACVPWLGFVASRSGGLDNQGPPILLGLDVLWVLPTQVILLEEGWPDPSRWGLGLGVLGGVGAGWLTVGGVRRVPALLLLAPVLLACVVGMTLGAILTHPRQLFPMVALLLPALWPMARRLPGLVAGVWIFPTWRLAALALGGLFGLPGITGLSQAIADRQPGGWVVIASPYLNQSGLWSLRDQPDVYLIDQIVDPKVPGLSTLAGNPRKTMDQLASAANVPSIHLVGHAQRLTIEPTLPPGWELRSTTSFRECMSLGSPVAGEIRVQKYGPERPTRSPMIGASRSSLDVPAGD